MPIQILPARLANQIAAGEVVERPASVVKELLENSLDSGATKIEIDIEKGGHKRILIRDNGSGIAKDELALALSRHATSKIAKLDDLEAICSLGFRGEALASISSVARLTLNSKPAKQSQGWQAVAEGRDMQVQLNPVAHPDGSSVDVQDLFFNTPARRKFLRTEKTEFSHIDELVRRIALSRYDVSFSLKHNNKLLRKYPAVKEQTGYLKRISAICGKDFAEHCIELNSQFDQFQLKGWIAEPEQAKASTDYQYFYVNGRMMRDKLIHHAIRQAFEGAMPEDCTLPYVLYLTLAPDQVDVNVHPAKHEVRFHKARLVHDFIFRALSDGLNQYFQQGQQQSHASPQVLPHAEPQHEYIQPLKSDDTQPNTLVGVNEQPSVNSAPSQAVNSLQGKTTRQHLVQSAPVIGQAADNYQRLMTASKQEQKPTVHQQLESGQLGQWLRVNEKQLLTKVDKEFYLLELKDLQAAQLSLAFAANTPASQPLLMPISITANEHLLAQAKKLYQALLFSSVEIGWTPNRIILRKVPAGFRQLVWAECLADILDVNDYEEHKVRKHLLTVLASHQDIANSQIQDWWQNSPEMAQTVQSVGKLMPLDQWIAQHD